MNKGIEVPKDFEKLPCPNCQGCGCTTCNGYGELLRPKERISFLMNWFISNYKNKSNEAHHHNAKYDGRFRYKVRSY